jgi:hypothetical protein
LYLSFNAQFRYHLLIFFWVRTAIILNIFLPSCHQRKEKVEGDSPLREKGGRNPPLNFSISTQTHNKKHFEGFTQKGNSQSGSLAKVYLVKLGKAGRNRE